MSVQLKQADAIIRAKMFFILGLLYTVFTIVAFWHLYSNFIRDRDTLRMHISTGVNLHLNDLLGEIALADTEAVKSHLDVIKNGFDLDKVSLKVSTVSPLPSQIDSSDSRQAVGPITRIVRAVFSAPYIDIPIVGGNGEIATVHAFYQNYLENSVTKPILTTFGIQFLLMLVTISMVALVINRLIDTVFAKPAKDIVGLIERISTGDFDITPQLQANYGSREIKTITDGLHSMANSIKKLQSDMGTQSALAAMGTLSAQVAHDIRSPLSSMQAALMVLRQQCGGNKDTKDYLDLLQLSSTRLEGISNGLLAKYKGEETGAQNFSIHEVLDELIGELRASPIGQGTEFVKHYHSNALYVSGDKTGVSRAIGNIIKNALEAMEKNPADRPKQLSVSTVFDDNQNLIVRFQDTGPGIPADKIPLILQGGHTDGKADGHGIGTKVVREVVDAHKGTLNIESEVGKGTAFIITFPVANIATQDSDLTVTIPYSNSSQIRVIDDEPSLREQWRLTLKALGAVVETYTCWEDFSNTLPPHPSPLPKGEGITTTFIVDYHFDNSEVDGIEVIRRLKERGYTQFVLATAEYWKPAIKDAAKELNITLCPKPLPKVVLQPTSFPQGDDSKQGPSVLLIDDDIDIQTSWKMMKKILGVGKLTMYSNLEDMIAAATDPAEFDVCVIDKNIEKSQYNGAKMLAYLKKNGARTVVVATGESRDAIANDPEFAAIDGILTSKVPTSLRELLNRKELS